MRMPSLEEMCLITTELHDRSLEPNHLTGLTSGTSLIGALARPYNQMTYGLVGDIFDVAASFCEALARGHVFRDGNKRTAFAVMTYILDVNDVRFRFPAGRTEDMMVSVAEGTASADQLAWFLRGLTVEASYNLREIDR